jgi:hypothetical protein
MDRNYWDKGVVISTKKTGQYRVIRSTDEAALWLLEHWPIEEGPAYLQARIACLNVLEGNEPVDVARSAFIAAAKEARIFVREDQR